MDTLPGTSIIPLPRLGTGIGGIPSASRPAAARLFTAGTTNLIRMGWFVRRGREREYGS